MMINYLLAHTKVPMSILDRIDKICRSFLWHDKDDRRGVHYVCLPQDQGGLGVKSMRLWSGPFRARLAWHFFQFPLHWHNSLLRETYGESLEMTAKHHGRSWKILQDGWRALKGAVRWKLRDGAQVSILNDVWILDIKLIYWPTFFNVSIEDSDKVVDLLDDGCWRIDAVQELFRPSLAEIILKTPVFMDMEKDKPELIYSSLSRSVTSQAFLAQFRNSDGRFNWLKSIKLLPRETMFWWRAIHDAIPSQDWLVRRGMEVSELCIWGCLVKEDLHHIMYHCKFSLKVFEVLESWGFPMPCINKFSVKVNNGLEFSQADVLFLKTVYHIWLNRNRKKHDDGWVSPTRVAALILGNFNLVNIDGAFKYPYRASLGIMVRDATGRLIMAAGKKILHWDVNYIELSSIALLIEVLNEDILGASGTGINESSRVEF
ncbi:hypothetical protein M5K25_022443 [Dendrobium thyrsiflorum]|uniref:Reverse transcriptase zinc-binding domain-containing protein n=1 Tax=Dendrobium thyrsiflorum TaxID=117978 RepID=A0ABD0U681_DENTH